MEFSIVTISAFVGVLNEVVKKIASIFNKDINKFIPLFSIGFGIILGICGYFIPNVKMGNNIIEAIFIGISSGAAATGCHQVYKQLKPEEAAYGLNEIRRVWENVDTRVLPWKLKAKPGYMPLKPFFSLFRAQEETYFFLRRFVNEK